MESGMSQRPDVIPGGGGCHANPNLVQFNDYLVDNVVKIVNAEFCQILEET